MRNLSSQKNRTDHLPFLIENMNATGAYSKKVEVVLNLPSKETLQLFTFFFQPFTFIPVHFLLFDHFINTNPLQFSILTSEVHNLTLLIEKEALDMDIRNIEFLN